MPAEVDISMATMADMDGIATVLCRAMEPDLIDRLFVPPGVEGAEAIFEHNVSWARSTFPIHLPDPDRRIFKATLKGTDQVVGYGAIAFSDGQFEGKGGTEKEKAKDEGEKEAEKPRESQGPPNFAAFYFGSMAAIRKKHMQGQKHVVWTSLHVLPKYQRQGIGTALLKWGFERFGLESEKVWIQTQMRGRNVYRRWGWTDVENFDVDLSRWAGPMKGFGVHRSPSMLRVPGKFERVEGIVNE